MVHTKIGTFWLRLWGGDHSGGGVIRTCCIATRGRRGSHRLKYICLVCYVDTAHKQHFVISNTLTVCVCGPWTHSICTKILDTQVVPHGVRQAGDTTAGADSEFYTKHPATHTHTHTHRQQAASCELSL